MRYRYLLFDLDGTLTDPGEGITASVAYAMSRFGIEVADRTSLYPFIGPPLTESFSEFYGFEGARLREAIDAFHAYYTEKGIWGNRVYDGVPALLGTLRARGYELVLATSKPEPFARRIFERFGLAGFFSHICGATMEETRTRKAEVVAYALEQCGAQAAEALMIGDRRHDVEGARACGLDCMGVLYGFGSRAELEQAGAAMLAATVGDVAALLG